MIINPFVLQDVAEEKRLKPFVLFLFYKSKFKKGCVFKYTDQRLASVIGVSVSTARNYRELWVKNGWCRFHAGRKGKYRNLIFNSVKDIYPQYKKFKIELNICHTVKETLDYIQFLLLQIKNSQFEYLKSLSREKDKPSSLKAYKRAIKRIRKLNSDKLPKQNDNFKISYAGIGKLLGCSMGKAHYLIKKYAQDGKINVIRGFRQVYNTNNRFVLQGVSDSVKNSFVHKNSVYRVYCNEYVFC